MKKKTDLLLILSIVLQCDSKPKMINSEKVDK